MCRQSCRLQFSGECFKFSNAIVSMTPLTPLLWPFDDAIAVSVQAARDEAVDIAYAPRTANRDNGVRIGAAFPEFIKFPLPLAIQFVADVWFERNMPITFCPQERGICCDNRR